MASQQSNEWWSRFGTKKPIIGMIHVDALPGTPKYNGSNFYRILCYLYIERTKLIHRLTTGQSVLKIAEKAVQEALIYKNAGIDALAIENMHDVPYLNTIVGPEVVAAMAIIGYEVKKASGLPTGIQILAAANKEAIAVAHSANLDFVRAEGFVFAHVADEVLES